MYSLVLILQDLPPLLFKWHLAILYDLQAIYLLPSSPSEIDY